MSLETFWPQSLPKMPRSAKKMAKIIRTLTNRRTSLNRVRQMLAARLKLAKAFQIMTEKISNATDEKLGPLAETVHNHTKQLEGVNNQFEEAERRIMVVEASSEDAQSCAFTLEKQGAMLTEHINDLENRGGHKNIRILGLREGGCQCCYCS